MTTDPYAYCPCGSGKKTKWCSPKVVPQVERVETLLEEGQRDAAIRLAEQLEREHPEPRCLKMLIRSVLVKCRLQNQSAEEALRSIEDFCSEFDEFGLPCEFATRVFAAVGETDRAIYYARRAFAKLPPELRQKRAMALMLMSSFFVAEQRPIAAWAAAAQAIKLAPNDELLPKVLESISESPVLPHFARRGIRLRSPDELALFNEDRRTRWDQALEGENDWNLEKARSAFEALVEDDPKDASGWFNLGIIHAWLGENGPAIDALDKYVRLETDPESAIQAWELAEVLRFGVGMFDYSDLLEYVLDFSVADEERFTSQFESLQPHCLAVRLGPETPPLLFLLDKERTTGPGEGLLIGAEPKIIARLDPSHMGVLRLISSSEADAKLAREIVESRLHNTINFEEQTISVANLGFVYLDRAIPISGGKVGKEAHNEKVAANLAKYFEEEWIHQPLKALDGCSPIDAAGGSITKRKLEAVIRNRERILSSFEVTYNMDRLRNKLGLTSLIPEGTKPADSPIELSTYSAAQLANVDAATLTDEQLVKAYQSANALDVPNTALKFGKELTKRPGAATLLDMSVVFRRLVIDRLDNRKNAEAAEFAAAALVYSKQHYGGKNTPELRSLEARCLAADGRKDEAAALYRDIMKEHPDELKVASDAIQFAMRQGNWSIAKEFADKAAEHARTTRNRDFQEQIREYQREIEARLK